MRRRRKDKKRSKVIFSCEVPWWGHVVLGGAIVALTELTGVAQEGGGVIWAMRVTSFCYTHLEICLVLNPAFSSLFKQIIPFNNFVRQSAILWTRCSWKWKSNLSMSSPVSSLSAHLSITWFTPITSLYSDKLYSLSLWSCHIEFQHSDAGDSARKKKKKEDTRGYPGL